MGWRNLIILVIFFGSVSGCLRYSFTGVSIPQDVRTIYIPLFPDNSPSGLSNLSDLLNEALVNRFVNQTRLRLSSSPEEADVVLDGVITSYTNNPFSVAGDQRAELNRVSVGVRASYRYTDEESPVFEKSFSGNSEYDPNIDPLEGETEAAREAMERIAQNIFSDSVGRW